MYCAFVFREILVQGIVDVYPYRAGGGGGGLRVSVVPKLMSELSADNSNMRYLLEAI